GGGTRGTATRPIIRSMIPDMSSWALPRRFVFLQVPVVLASRALVAHSATAGPTRPAPRRRDIVRQGGRSIPGARDEAHEGTEDQTRRKRGSASRAAMFARLSCGA